MGLRRVVTPVNRAVPQTRCPSRRGAGGTGDSGGPQPSLTPFRKPVEVERGVPTATPPFGSCSSAGAASASRHPDERGTRQRALLQRCTGGGWFGWGGGVTTRGGRRRRCLRLRPEPVAGLLVELQEDAGGVGSVVRGSTARRRVQEFGSAAAGDRPVICRSDSRRRPRRSAHAASGSLSASTSPLLSPPGPGQQVPGGVQPWCLAVGARRKAEAVQDGAALSHLPPVCRLYGVPQTSPPVQSPRSPTTSTPPLGEPGQVLAGVPSPRPHHVTGRVCLKQGKQKPDSRNQAHLLRLGPTSAIFPSRPRNTGIGSHGIGNRDGPQDPDDRVTQRAQPATGRVHLILTPPSAADTRPGASSQEPAREDGEPRKQVVSGCCCSELEECWSNGSHPNSRPDRSSPAVVTSASITSSGSMTAHTGWTSRRRGARPHGEARAPTGTTPGVPPPPASSQQCAACHPSGGRRGRPQWSTGGDCENRCPITGAR
ncbi:hypothetical protein JYK04_08088 [Streptomyces nojiriensis]|nr:hypothetical protein JYK04_08088 [Streptomyces nojiriensis]